MTGEIVDLCWGPCGEGIDLALDVGPRSLHSGGAEISRGSSFTEKRNLGMDDFISIIEYTNSMAELAQCARCTEAPYVHRIHNWIYLAVQLSHCDQPGE